MKLSEDFIVYDMGGETTLVPVGKAAEGYHGIVRCNKTAAFLVECLKHDTDEAALLEQMKAKYDGEEERMRASIRKTLDSLRSIGALVE